jgi:lipopolysaccharide transport system permease protein
MGPAISSTTARLLESHGITLSACLFLWRHRHLILHTTYSDTRGRYSGSILGSLWAVLSPLLLLGVYILVYVVILRVRMPNAPGASALDYILVIFAGLVPWFGFSEATTASLSSVVGNPNLIHNTSFPAPVLPVKAVLASLIGQSVGLMLLMLLLAFTNRASLYWLLVPVAVIVQVTFSLGLGWILAVLNVFVRDLGQVISSLLLMLLFVSPIAYTREFIGDTRARLVLDLNPLSHLIELYRAPLVYGRAPAPLSVLVATGLALACFWLGFRFFVSIKPHLADHV